MEASGHTFLRLLWGGNSGSVNLLSRKVGGLPGSSRIPPEGTSEPVSVWEDGKPWPGAQLLFLFVCISIIYSYFQF